MSVGFDLGARAIVGVALAPSGRVADVRVFPADEVEAAAGWAAGLGGAVAVDAPEGPSPPVHPAHAVMGLAPKFRAARCGEIALGREHGIWVPWVAPAQVPGSGWMAVGLRLFAALARRGARAAEVYPHAVFRVLGGGVRPPRKTLPAGARARIALLRAAGVRADHLDAWSHDALDALAAALVASDIDAGRARRVSCDHDGSAIWLPASRA